MTPITVIIISKRACVKVLAFLDENDVCDHWVGRRGYGMMLSMVEIAAAVRHPTLRPSEAVSKTP